MDEFQDTNRAAAELLLLIAGDTGGGLWVVGDQNQSIYRFRGASPGNLPATGREYYPQSARAAATTLLSRRAEHRALGSAMAAQMARLALTAPVPSTGALREALQPLDLEPVRSVSGQRPLFCTRRRSPAPRTSALGWRRPSSESIQRLPLQRSGDPLSHAQAGAPDCRRPRPRDVPVSQLGDFFERPEVKDALMLLTLASGPDARGVLRAAPLLVAVGCPPPVGGELAARCAYLSIQRPRFPARFRMASARPDSALSPETRAGLVSARRKATRDTRIARPLASGWRRSCYVQVDMSGGWRVWLTGRMSHGDQCALPGMEARAAQCQANRRWRRLVNWCGWRGASTPLGGGAGVPRPLEPRGTPPRRGTPRRNPIPSTPAPNADVISDVMPSAAPASARRATATEEIAPVVTCFLHYLHALRATDVVVPSRPGMRIPSIS